MNPVIRTGAGVVDDKTTRVVLASNSPQFEWEGLRFDRMDESFYIGTNNLNSITYRLNGSIVRYITFEYIDDPNTTVGARVSKVVVAATPFGSGQGDTDDPGDDEVMMGWSGGSGGGEFYSPGFPEGEGPPE
jgi:hypothetical protein